MQVKQKHHLNLKIANVQFSVDLLPMILSILERIVMRALWNAAVSLGADIVSFWQTVALLVLHELALLGDRDGLTRQGPSLNLAFYASG